MPEILRRRPDARLGIVGSGPEEETLKRQADRLGVAHAVTFHGAVINAEIPNLYRRATVFVAPSIVTAQGDQEGLGLVLVEALGCGCTVVASDLPAIRDVVSDGVTGLLCKQRDSLDIATKVCTLLEHTELRLSLGRAGRQHVQERFDWSAISRRYALLIDGLIRDRS
jgi:glycosyltransferase involved in cell wall biosynthesis